jgi:hypothetical protein
MSEDEEDEPSSEADFEKLMESIQEEREDRQEQVSFEWVETVREAGELWRNLEDVEAVADQVDLSLEKTREALTVYRLTFQDPSDVAMKASRPGRAYFSLEQELDEEFDEEEEGEPVEVLLREYVGALYLDHDIEELPVGEPPEEVTPSMPVDWEELSETFSQSFTVPESTMNALANAVDSDLFRTEKMVADAIQPLIEHRQQMIANAVQPLIEHRERMIANAVQPLVNHQQQMLAQSLAPLTAALDHHQSLMAQSTAAMMSEAVQDIAFPDSVLADLASMQPAMDVAAAATTHTHPSSQFEESVVDEASKTSVEAEPLEATGEVVPETGPGGAMLDSTLPDADAFTTELVVEVPAMVVESMLSTGKARVWFSNLSEEHQLTAVRLLLASVAVYVTGNPFAAPVAIIPAPSVRRAIVVED